MWIAEQIAAQAERETWDEKAIRRRLVQVERDYELGALTLEEYEAIEDQLLEQIELLQGRDLQETEA